MTDVTIVGTEMQGRTAPYGALVLRIALGLVFVAHSLFKVAITLPVAAEFFVRFGFPGWSVYPVLVVELVGGLLLLMGVAVRPVAAALLAVVVGAFRVHGGNGWNFDSANGGWEYLAVLAAGLIAVMLLGPGAARLRPGRTTALDERDPGRRD